MSLTYSEMMPLGTVAPSFKLTDELSGRKISPESEKKEHGLVVMFICNHCPYVLHIENEIGNIANAYRDKGIGFIAITSNDIDNYPEDGPEGMKDQAERAGFNFPYVIDASQEVAKSYQAACTPDFFLFDGGLKCVYRGRLDAASPKNGQPNDGSDLRKVLDQLINGESISENQLPSMGCNIKWRS